MGDAVDKLPDQARSDQRGQGSEGMEPDHLGHRCAVLVQQPARVAAHRGHVGDGQGARDGLGGQCHQVASPRMTVSLYAGLVAISSL